MAHAKAGEYDAAQRCYAQALELDPAQRDAHVARGAALANCGMLERGVEACEEALRIDPDDANAARYRDAMRAKLAAQRDAGAKGDGGTGESEAAAVQGSAPPPPHAPHAPHAPHVPPQQQQQPGAAGASVALLNTVLAAAADRLRGKHSKHSKHSKHKKKRKKKRSSKEHKAKKRVRGCMLACEGRLADRVLCLFVFCAPQRSGAGDASPRKSKRARDGSGGSSSGSGSGSSSSSG